MNAVDRDQSGPVAALAAAILLAFLQVSVSIWYLAEVAAGNRHACTGHVCDTPVPEAVGIGRYILWGGLFASLVVTIWFGARWVLGDRGWRGLAIAAVVSWVLLVATVVLALVYPPWSRAG